MNIEDLFTPKATKKIVLVFVICILVMVAAQFLAWQVQTDFGRVEVSNVTFPSDTGITIRAKLLRPDSVTEVSPAPGIIYLHGYQNNRETSDPYCIELARRGIVALCVDLIGRGNSGVPLPLDDPGFDETFGAEDAFEYLKQLPFVDPDRVGIMGHSVGGEIAYQLALARSDVAALVISGTAYTTEATTSNPANMLMIFGKYDEYRKRMTGTKDYAAEWMSSEQTRAAIGEGAEFSVTYGDFADGTARRVYMPIVTHIQESHSKGPVAEAVAWMSQALGPVKNPSGLAPTEQIWEIKEFATLVAMLACFASLFPLILLLLRLPFFADLRLPVGEGYVATKKDFRRGAVINGIFMLLYLGLIMVIFGFHVYVLQIDRVFPMMIVNGIAFWFLVSNLLGFWAFKRWFRRKYAGDGLTMVDLGISSAPDRLKFSGLRIGKAALLALIVFGFAYLCEWVLESLWIVDFRFIFPFASDLTGYRVGMFLLYMPFFLVGFVQMGIFLYGQMRRPIRTTWFKTLAGWSGVCLLVMVTPLLIHLALQYLPLFTVGVIPFVGPSAALVGFMINLVHIIMVLILVVPLSTWLFQLTGNIYAGAFLNTLLVTWMFISSQVIAPIPV